MAAILVCAVVFLGVAIVVIWCSYKTYRRCRSIDHRSLLSAPEPQDLANATPFDDPIEAIDDKKAKKVLDIRGIVKKVHAATGIMEAVVPANELDALSEDSDILYIAPDRMVRPTMDYAMAAIQLTSTIRSQWSGAGIGVAVIDSGIDPHLDLFRGFTSALVYQESFLPLAALDLKDSYGHGTHVAGIIAGNSNSTQFPESTRSFAGVAPKVNLISLKVLDANGAGTDSMVIAATRSKPWPVTSQTMRRSTNLPKRPGRLSAGSMSSCFPASRPSPTWAPC